MSGIAPLTGQPASDERGRGLTPFRTWPGDICESLTRRPAKSIRGSCRAARSSLRDRPRCRGGYVFLHTKLVQQCLGLLQIERVEALAEPPVDRREQSAGLIALALVAPEPGKAGGGAQLPRLCLLRPGNLPRLEKAGLGSGEVVIAQAPQHFAPEAIQLRLEPALARPLHPGKGFGEERQRVGGSICLASDEPEIIRHLQLRPGRLLGREA